MSLFRSEEMSYYDLCMPRESAWEIMNELGQHGALEFEDLNENENVFDRPYASYIKRCEEMMLNFEYIQQEMARFECELVQCPSIDDYLENLASHLEVRQKAESTFFSELENEVVEKIGHLRGQIIAYEKLSSDYNHFLERKYVLRYTRSFLGEDQEFLAQNVNDEIDVEKEKAEGEDMDEYVASLNSGLNYIDGIVN